MALKKPKLGQHFLTNLTARQRIVDALGDISGCTVIEIGPGRGAITDLLVPHARRLIAIELDRDLAPALAAYYASASNVQILAADILTVKLAELRDSSDTGDLVVVGNLPYYITSDILLWLFAQTSDFSRAVLMMQEEVADRITALPGGSEYGLLSATTQLHANAEKLFPLPPGVFSPPPKVNSAVVRLHPAPRFAELNIERQPFLNFLRACFQQKRKTLANNLRAAGYTPEQITTAAHAAALDTTLRTEAVSLDAMARLFLALGV
ncbi:MAG TPA: 16S rRNA (adenine(1518)-N(6)/adenine(1519)-N(6))-dimethyltransferase RsmA [Acidobacteriaceae bacterium]|jgi:16S rRNA (adenine1518-N6/adenine1519-N6)-dimethyltransferase|nr:16S rRNA (adenine(1518)-N(6)/adenine(1519)-N(6))-dimethyltransferase RsmA [Acidobacteriaceae bacterium]